MRERSRIGGSEANRCRSIVGEFDLAAEVFDWTTRGATRSRSRGRIDRPQNASRGVVSVVGECQFAEIVERVTGVVVGSTPHVITHGSVPSDFQELLLFALYRPVDVLDVIVCDLVEFLLCPLDVVR
jgi:hypothetical protein